MALFQEIDPLTFAGGRIIGIEPGSVADELELRPGDELIAINDQAVRTSSTCSSIRPRKSWSC